MVTQYFCDSKGRRQAVADSTRLNGIDYLEVSDNQRELAVHFLNNLPDAPTDPVPPDPALALTKDNVLIEGGVRVRNVRVDSLQRTGDNAVTVTVDASGDFSTYVLRLVASPTNAKPPDGFDPQLSHVAFSFKVDCPSEFDCPTDPPCPTEKLPEPEIDYLAKDYNSFRRLMLDRMSVIMPNWRDRNPADVQVALVELLAYVGDHLSYYQDAVATEAYLGTARKRVSVRRHARLLDYFMHDGCNARAWVCFEVNNGAGDGLIVPGRTPGSQDTRGTPVLTQAPDNQPLASADIIISKTDFGLMPVEDLIVFETMYEVTLRHVHNRISFYTWGDAECCLPRGSTSATLRNDPTLSLDEGYVVVFEEIRSPTTGKEADANPSHRHAVRLKIAEPTTDPLDDTPVLNIEWGEEDALPFPLCISALIDEEGAQTLQEISVARGNVVLADHGRTFPNEGSNTNEYLVPEVVPERGLYRPRLPRAPLTYEGRAFSATGPAIAAMRCDVRDARPRSTRLTGGDDEWTPQYDLLGSDRFATEFVVEMESDGVSHLRFGDGVLGKKPQENVEFTAQYRVGNGTVGNVGAEALARVVLDVTDTTAITRVWNPLPATGGIDPEPAEHASLLAPYAFWTQERAVTEADYAEVAQRHPDVQRAVANVRWTGSWYTVFVTIDRRGGRLVDEGFEKEMRDFLERYRIAGYDLEINAPIFVSLDIFVTVCVQPGYFRSRVKQALLDLFSNRDLPGGRRGFFHPDNLTFGQPVYLSQIYRAAMDVPGVASIEVSRFQRWGKAANQELENGVLGLGTLEVARLDNDPNFPENGKMKLIMKGGL